MIGIEPTGGQFYKSTYQYILNSSEFNTNNSLICFDSLGGSYKKIIPADIISQYQVFDATSFLDRNIQHQIEQKLSSFFSSEVIFSLSDPKSRSNLARLSFNGLRLGNYIISTVYRDNGLSSDVSDQSIRQLITQFIRIFYICGFLVQQRLASIAVFTHDIYMKGWTSDCLAFLGVKILPLYKFVFSYTKNIDYPFSLAPNTCSEYTNAFRWHIKNKSTLMHMILSLTYSRGDFDLEESKMDSHTIEFNVKKLIDKLLHATRPILY